MAYLDLCRRGITKNEMQALALVEKKSDFPLIKKITRTSKYERIKDDTNKINKVEIIGNYKEIVDFQTDLRTNNIDAIAREIDNQYKGTNSLDF